LRGILEKSFVFYTNYSSAKAKDLDENNNVSLNFFWPYLEKQVRVKGIVSKLSDSDSDAYFNSRPFSSQIGAHSSQQSNSLPLNYSFENIVSDLEKKYKNQEVGRPVFWGGYKIEISYFEFWQGRPSRLHDRLCYKLVDKIWTKNRLSP
jgi:pyridoxamine 5'-phosphate oxidase